MAAEEAPTPISAADEQVTSDAQAPPACTSKATKAADEGDEQPQPMSKNKMKKLAKQQKIAAARAQRKAQEKAAKAAAREARLAKAAAAPPLSEEEIAARRAAKQERTAAFVARKGGKRERMKKALENGTRVVIDLSFWDLMTDGERKSLRQQLMYCYAANMRAAAPVHMVLTGLGGGMAELLQRTVSGFDNWQITREERCYTELFASQRGSLCYLTADSEHEVADVRDGEDTIYIIGGIVDRNRHKNICRDKAAEQGLATARLPLDAHVEMSAAPVLTVNQVFDILLKQIEHRDWAKAVAGAIPLRKRKHGGDAKSNGATSEGVKGPKDGGAKGEGHKAGANGGEQQAAGSIDASGSVAIASEPQAANDGDIIEGRAEETATAAASDANGAAAAGANCATALAGGAEDTQGAAKRQKLDSSCKLAL